VTPDGGSSGAISRRAFVGAAGLTSAGLLAAARSTSAAAAVSQSTDPHAGTVPFYATHQAGIITPAQDSLVFAAYDVTGADRSALLALLRTWTRAAARLCAGELLTGDTYPGAPDPDTGEALGLGPSHLTVTAGFGPSLFDGRFGLAPRRPAALADLPAFAGDALDPTRSGGDLCIQACADDALVAFHAVHNLTRLALGTATVRYVQLGFGRTSSTSAQQTTPRNLMGFKDGTDNLTAQDSKLLERFVWVGDEGDQSWMRAGTYLVDRRIRIHLEAWDRSTLLEQEQTVGRAKATGAPLGSAAERDPVNLKALGADGLPVIPAGAHIRVAAPVTNRGERLLRRGFNFADGVDPATGELDAGLFFICFQRDPRLQFVAIQTRLAEQDAMRRYLLHTASGLFACPGGPAPGGSWGDPLS
jgi:deferrochelatase/peroxidase EfeB